MSNARKRLNHRLIPKPSALALFSVVLLTLVFLEKSSARAEERAKSVTPLDAGMLARAIDEHIDKRLAAEKIQPGPRSADAEFLRRAYLDLAGSIPTSEKTVAFLDSGDPDKRARLIDELLAGPQHSRHMAGIWASRLIPRELASVGMNRNTMVEKLGAWFDDGFQKNTAWDKLVRDLITAKGVPDENGAAMLFVNPDVDKLTDAVGRMFLGVQLQCAQCHDDRLGRSWKRADYWAMAAFFFKVRDNRMRAEEAAKLGLERGITEQDAPRSPKRKLPATATVVPPKFLAGAEAKLVSAAPYRPALAEWMTAPTNPYFARSMVNRQWAHLFGHGLVTPVDDLHDKNPASHPELLQLLSEQFIAHGFDVKFVLRTICLSDAYQRTSISRESEEYDRATELFARMAVKDLTLRQLKNAREVMLPKKQGNGPKPLLYADLIEDADATEFRKGIPDTLIQMNAKETGAFLKDLTARLVPVKSAKPAAENLETIYLHILSRRPTAEEIQRLKGYVERQGVRAYPDICWALLNSAEFLLNH